jgi:transcriptional regulator with PAS, ATPase and Fis domain
VFLDEIGEMTMGLQATLLRFLEEKRFKRVAGLTDIRVDVRVAAATNRDLEHEVEKGRFREDLFCRLQVMPILLPSLRERRGDVALLAKFYINRFNGEFRKHVRGLMTPALDLLDQYPWPGEPEPDPRGRALGAEPRSGALPDGEVRPSIGMSVLHSGHDPACGRCRAR